MTTSPAGLRAKEIVAFARNLVAIPTENPPGEAYDARSTRRASEYAARILDEVADDDAVFTVDTGMCNVWAARYITPNSRRRVIGSFRHGSMANALPHAIGAQLAYPGRQVVSMSGDGGLGMLLGELLTVALHELPVKIVTFNNSSLGMVKLEMLVDGLPDYGTDHAAVDFAAIARAAGIESVRVEQPGDIGAALEETFGCPGPALVDLVTDPNALSMPPHLNADQVKGFALAAGKIVLDVGVSRMLEMARANVRNIPRPATLACSKLFIARHPRSLPSWSRMLL